MPRIPEGYGPRPVPQASLTIARQRNAGAVGQAAAQFGAQVAGTGLAQLEKQDKLAYAAAKSAYISASEQAKREFQDDQDYATFDQRYQERMKSAREESSKLIQTKSDRSIFEAEVDVLFERDRSNILDLARGKRVDSGRAMVAENGDAMLDIATNAIDGAAILSAIGSHDEMIDGAVQQGLYTRQEAVVLKKEWASAAVQSRLNNAISRDALEEAQTIYNELADNLPWQTRSQVFDRLAGAFENRENVGLIDSLVGKTAEPGQVNYHDPLRGKGQKPVAGGEFGAERDYGAHQGVDHPAPAGTSVFSMAAGVATISKSDKGGNIVTVKHYDGAVSRYMHLGGVSIENGAAVTPDTVIGTVGTTGRTTGPHLHLEVIGANGKEVDPGEVMGKASAPRQEYDLRNIYAAIDTLGEQSGYSPERIARLKQEADLRVQRYEALQSRDDQANIDSAWNIVANLGAGFTDTSQIPNFGLLPPATRIQITNAAEQNRKPAEPDANGSVVRALHRMAIDAPAAFAGADLRPYQSYMTDAEFDELSQSQARTVESVGKWSPRTGVSEAIGWGEKFGGVKLEDDELYRTYRYMEGRAIEWRQANGGKEPTNKEYEAFFLEATRQVKTKDTFLGIDWLNPDETARASEVLGKDHRALIIRQFRAVNGRAPTEAEITDWYERMGEAL